VAERTLLSRTACLPPPRDSLIIARRVRMSADQKSHSSLPTGPSGLHRQVTTRLALRSSGVASGVKPVAVHAHPVEADVKLLRDDRRTAEDVHLRGHCMDPIVGPTLCHSAQRSPSAALTDQ
jgi:hypothetical protein